MEMQSLRRTVVIFSLAALVGPLLSLLSSMLKLDTMSAPPGSRGVADFLYDFVLLLWPPQVLGVIEAVVGTVVAALLTVGANILLFALAGRLRWACRSHAVAAVLLWVVISAAVSAIALWASGYDAVFVNVPALTLAYAFYAVLIWVTGSARDLTSEA
jgi:ABC-type maltose transport system permease subunit